MTDTAPKTQPPQTQVPERPDPETQASVPVELGERSYDIKIASGLLHQAGEMIKDRLGQRKCAIITDENIAPLHLGKLQKSLEQAGLSHDVLILPPGEATKNFTPFANACETLLQMQIERGDLIIAFGGGVVGDFAGFAASILRRGMDFVQIPTTLLAQVDSSVGGKTGINTKQGKNLVGCFHQPRLVIIDTDVLHTLPQRELRAGYAEVVKYGLIDDPVFFAWLEEYGPRLLTGDEQARIYAIATSCRAKARIVALDEREGGVRALLNLGHTFGHALEAFAQYDGSLLHGEGISIGMVMAFELSEQLGYCQKDATSQVEAHFKSVGLPTRVTDLPHKPGPSASQLLATMAQDKKVVGGKLVFIMAHDIGESFVDKSVPMDALANYLEGQCCT
ncbi:MAG: 3-dehydroquinate synthase [Hyphomicrobiaceae bacterium]|nr:3-dehydroquinate synthase [Hyphomicrobiaceae bacterium]